MSSIGPSIPAHLIAKQPTPKNDPPEDNDSDDSDSFAPALPPDIILTQRVLGPSFPSGPPPEREDDSSDDDYGPAPLPEGVEEVEHDPVKEFMEKEERRRKNAEASRCDFIERVGLKSERSEVGCSETTETEERSMDARPSQSL